MSIITSNASCNPSSISVTGKTNGSGTISWSLPTVPAGGTINSCKLTGTCTITDSSGKPATVKVNGTSVSSGVAFTINLGTGNTTSSVAVAATGPHKNTKSTITFSNLVYTVDYETNVTYTVTFKDWNGTVLKTETVKEGSSATAPSNPIRDGHRFTGWDKDFSSITSDLTVTAQYKEIIEKEMCIYSFDSSINTLPVFNDGYEYRYTDATNSDGTITRTILSDIEPTAINFKECTGLKTLDYMDLTNLIKFENMFNKCTSLTTVKLENCPANANTVNNFQYMFSGCTSLTHAYISGINFENAQYMNYMFHSCSSLEYVDFGNFNSIHGLDFAATFFYNTTRTFTTVVVDNPPANSMNKLIGLLPVRASTLPSGTIIHNATDTSEWDIETLNSRNWQLSNNNLLRYTVTFKDWDGAVLKIQTVEEGSSATAPSDPIRDGHMFIGWDKDFSSITSDLTVTAQYVEMIYYIVTFVDWDGTVLKTEQVGEGYSATAPSDPIRTEYEFIGWDVPFDNIISDLIVTAQYKKINTIIEHTGSGIVVTDLRAFVDHADYKINIDWNSEYFDVIIKEDLNYDFRYMTGAEIGNFVIGDYAFSIYFSDYYFTVFDDEYNEICLSEEELALPVTVRFTKNKIQILDMNNIVVISSDESYELNQPIYLYEDYRVVDSNNDDFDLKFDLVVSEHSGQPEESIIEWTGLGTVATELRARGENHDNYKINLDWENECFDIVIVESVNYNPMIMNPPVSIGDIVIGENKYCITDDEGFYSLYLNDNTIYESEEQALSYPIIRFNKDGIYLISENEALLIAESIYETDQPIYVYEDNESDYNNEYDLKFNLVVSEYSGQPEEPDNNELVQGDINDESGVYEDEVSNVVKTKYIDISDKKQILVNVLTEDVYILKCYLYNANKELVKVIDISADKKRMFGLDLQKLIEEVMNDGNE